VPRTRTGVTWFGFCVAALSFVVLIVFMLQNTRTVQVSFLGMHGNLPLALALLIAAVGAAILTMDDLATPRSTPRPRMEPTGSRRTLVDGGWGPARPTRSRNCPP
jgi:uncharacterized integral membrane protein